ncbi:MAG: hypothetical protein ACFCU1_14010 [Sumerlaeia bacterium]
MTNSSAIKPIEVYEVKKGEGRPGISSRLEAIETISSDSPIPMVGDIIVLSNLQDASIENLQRFKVIKRETIFSRIGLSSDQSSKYSKKYLFVVKLDDNSYKVVPALTR